MPDTAPPPAAPPPTSTPDLSEQEFYTGLTQVIEQTHGRKSDAPAQVTQRPAATPGASGTQPPRATPPPAPPPPSPPKLDLPPPPATPPTTTEPPPTEPVRPTAAQPVPDLASRKSEQWKEVNADRDKLRAEVDKLRTEVQNFQRAVHPDFDKVVKERDEYQRILREVAVERDPEVMGPVTQKYRDAVETAKSLVAAEYHTELEKLLQSQPTEARDAAMEQIAGNLAPLRRTRFDNAVLEAEAAMRERAALLSRSQDAINRRTQQELDRRKAFAAEFDTELRDWQSDQFGVDLLRTKQGADTDATVKTHNERVVNIIDSARALYNGHKLTPREFARAAISAVLEPYLSEQNYAQAQKITELEKIITQLKGGGPPAVPGGNGEATQQQADEEWTPDSGVPLAKWLVQQAERKGMFGR